MIEPRKSHFRLLQAFKLARENGLELRWKVVGAIGRCSDEIVAALRAEPAVDLLGHVPYRGALFHAMPSHAEGFGFPPLEAMARGTPTVCSTGSALEELGLRRAALFRLDEAAHGYVGAYREALE